MREVIIGAGAIGASIGGLLTEAGHEVVLVARGAHLEAMRDEGLRPLLPERRVEVRPAVADGPGALRLRTDDVLVLTTKTQQAEAALAQWADVPVHDEHDRVVGTAGETLPLLTALNGVASEAMALRWFARVIGVCVWMPAVLTAPGEVVVRCTPTRAVLHAARYPASIADEADAALLDAIAARWADAGLEVPLPDDVMPWKHRKLLGNLGNAVQALLGEGHGGDLVEAAREEAVALYAEAGIVMNAEDDEQRSRSRLQVHDVPGAPTALGGSTWQSLRRSAGTVETDYLNGEIVAIAHRLGRRAPINAVLARLLRTAAAEGWQPGSMTEPALREQLGLSSRTASGGRRGAR